MATVTGTSIKINGAVSGQGTMPQTLYTAPANGYAILNAYLTSGFLLVGGRFVLQAAGGTTVTGTIYVGPSQSVQIAAPGASLAAISGVEFINSP